ncbi:MAG: PEP-CTERM sorting domain-containing protein [Planctomycetota bacterium]
MTRTACCFLTVGLLGFAPAGSGEVFEFTLDIPNSVIDIERSSTFDLFGNLIDGEAIAATTPPAAVTRDSFQARYGGSLQVDLTANTIEILDTSLIAALDEDRYTPGFPSNPTNAEPASYAAVFGRDTPTAFDDFSYATRGLEFEVRDSDGFANTLNTNGTFAALGNQLFLSDGRADIQSGNASSSDLTTFSAIERTAENTSADAGTLVTVGNVQTLTLPVEFTLTLLTEEQSGNFALVRTQTVYSGEIVASRIIPEPTTAAWLLLGSAGLLRRRRSRKPRGI